MKINCIVIDDEPLALELLESYIKRIPYLSLKGLYHDPCNALEVIRSGKVDLVFIDIHMPDISGIEFLKSLEVLPRFVFVTAHDKFAILGFEMNAIDYLLKPVSFSRFLKASDRVLTALRQKTSFTENYIFVKTDRSSVKISFDSIYFIEGYKDYVKIYTNNGNPVLTQSTLKAIEELLPESFLRVHRSYIISVDKIVSFRNSKVYIRDRYIPVGESYSEQFQQLVIEGRLY
jgi:DNA-binding LytR/AlgR family response regulator